MEGYLSIRETAEKWGVSERRINQYCSEGRIPGAEQFGGAWAIPADAENPVIRANRKNRLRLKNRKKRRSCSPALCP